MPARRTCAKGGAGFGIWYLQRSNPNHLTVTRDEIRYRDPLVCSHCFVIALCEIEGIKIRDRVRTRQLCDINYDQVAAAHGIDRTKSALSYEVYSQDGAEVAEGLIGGESVELDRGINRVVVITIPRHVFEKVEIAGDEAIELEVADRAALCRFFDFARQFGMIGCRTALI